MAETVEQIIAEIVAEDQMTQTLRDARRKIRKFGGDVDKLNDVLKDNEKQALKAARADKKLSDETAKLARKSEQAKKGIEGLAQGMGVSAVSGERLANVYLAAGAAAGAMLFAVGSLVKSGIEAYIESSDAAKGATERFNDAQKRLLVTLGEAVVGGEEYATTVDGMSSALDGVTAEIGKHSEDIRGFVQVAIAGVGSIVQALIKTTATGLSVVPGLIDLIIAHLGNVADFWVGAVEAIAEGFGMLGVISDQAVAGFVSKTNKLQEEIAASTDLQHGFVASIDDTATGLGNFVDRITQAALGVETLNSSLVQAGKAGRGAAAAFGVTSATPARRRRGARRAKRQISGAESGFESGGFVDDTTAGDRERAAFEAHQTALKERLELDREFAAMQEHINTTMAEGTSLSASRVLEIERANQAMLDSVELGAELDATFMGLATGGVSIMAGALGDMTEQLVAGEFQMASFGAALAAQFGDLMQQVGEGMIALSTAALLVEGGGIFASPLAGLAAGAALMAAGGALKGFAKRGTKKGGARGATRQAAEEVTDVVTSRLGIGRDRDQRAGDVIKVFIGQEPIRDLTTRAVRDAITNREIPTLSPAGAAL